MAILTSRPPETDRDQVTKKTNKPLINEPGYRSTVVDTKYKNLSSLLTHIEGAAWLVKYYSQVIGPDGELSPLQVTKDPVYQQYMEISDLELKVTTALSTSQDTDSGVFEVVGTSTVYPPIVPNYGDAFLADIGDGREGIFTITSSRRLSILTIPCYEIEYVFAGESDKERLNDLERKTIKKVVFVKRMMEHGQNPLLVSSEYNDLIKIESVRKSLLGTYFSSFFNKRISSLAVPSQDYLTFDPFLVKALTSIIETDEFPLIRSVKNYSIEFPEKIKPKTIWDAMLENRVELLPLCSDWLSVICATTFSSMYQYEGVYFSGIQDVVYPYEHDDRGFIPSFLKEGKLGSRDIRHQFKVTRLDNVSLLDQSNKIGVDTLPQIYPVTKDKYYVFTEAFYYHRYEEQSQLETLVRNSLEGKGIDVPVLLEMCESSPRWTDLDRFYYVPMLLILLKMATRL